MLLDLSKCIDFSQLSRYGYRITTKTWTSEDIQRIAQCFREGGNSNQFVACLKRRRTDALAIRRYLLSRQIAMLVPGVYECPGSGKYKTCEVLYEADPLQLPLWYDLSCVIETVNNAIIDASGCEEEGSFVQATGVQIRQLEGEMDYGPIVDLDLETRVICDNKDLTGILPPWVVT